jgi:hypothetical protein
MTKYLFAGFLASEGLFGVSQSLILAVGQVIILINSTEYYLFTFYLLIYFYYLVPLYLS